MPFFDTLSNQKTRNSFAMAFHGGPLLRIDLARCISFQSLSEEILLLLEQSWLEMLTTSRMDNWTFKLVHQVRLT